VAAFLKLVMIADTFPPARNSGAVQLNDLAFELGRQGHSVTVVLPLHSLKRPSQIQEIDGIRILRIKAPKTKGINYVRRTLNELVMPYFMMYCLVRKKLSSEEWDGIIWYSPSIFHGPLVKFLKRSNNCKGYLILRDIFPEWALEIGLIRRGLIYSFFSAMARYQYSLADVIGVQTEGNLKYFRDSQAKLAGRIEVLPNWLGEPIRSKCSIRISETSLSGRKIFIYAGNMGVAQGMDILIDLAYHLQSRRDVGFLFVGRGEAFHKLKSAAKTNKLKNILFHAEIPQNQIFDLYSECHVGLISLDCNHKSHNIPGKFLGYLQSGLPVLAKVNAGNDISKLIRDEQVGQVCENDDIEQLKKCADSILENLAIDEKLSERCKKLFSKKYSVKIAAKRILFGLS